MDYTNLLVSPGILILALVIGLSVMGWVARRPKLFWPLLVFVSVGTAGLMVGGYTFIDEYLIGFVLIGGLLAILTGAITIRKSTEDIWDHLHIWIFLLMVLYMIFQSLRGLVLLESLRKSRWVIYYGMLGVLSFMVSNKGFPVPNARKVSLMVSGSGLVYLLLYLAHGLFTEVVRGISRFEVQPGEWSTTAYALFPLVVVIPSAIFLIRDRSYKYQWVGWGTLILAILATFYYSSRISWLVIIGFLYVCLFKSRWGKAVAVCLAVLIFGLFFWITSRPELIHSHRTPGLLKDLSIAAENIRLRAPEEIDPGRYIHMRVAFISITGSLKNLLFGYGFRTHGTIISPRLRTIWEDIGFPELAARVRDDESTEAFTALLVDTGLVGMLLLSMNFFFLARKILLEKENLYRPVLLLSLLFAFLWLPVINIVDIMLFYLLIMPSGLLVQLSGYRAERVFEQSS